MGEVVVEGVSMGWGEVAVERVSGPGAILPYARSTS